MKSILMAIAPKWCELIASGRKTIEVRKTAPKETPFKVYMYMAKDAKKHYYIDEYGDRQVELIPQKVIGEFVCDKVSKIYKRLHIRNYDISLESLERSCLDCDTLWEYGKGKTLYRLYISQLKIYDKPKELGEFENLCPKINKKREDCVFCKFNNGRYGALDCQNQITRPPQNWYYVEELLI